MNNLDFLFMLVGTSSFFNAFIMLLQNWSFFCCIFISCMLVNVLILSLIVFMLLILLIAFLESESATLFSLPFLYIISKSKSNNFNVSLAILAEGIFKL